MSGELEQRVAAAAAAPAQRGPMDLRAQIENMTPSFQVAMPKGFDAGQLVRDAFTCLRQTPKLAECEPRSVLGSLMTAAQLGLRPAVLGQCWLLPVKDRRNNVMNAQLIIGYQGYQELAYRSPRVASISSRIVYEADEFRLQYGDDERLIHVPYTGTGPRGRAIGYYTTARLAIPGMPNTVPKFEYMSRAEMETHRDRFAMAKNYNGVVGPWKDHFDQMALKTTSRRLSKTLPKSAELMVAYSVDGGIRTDVAPTADVLDVTQIIDEVETVDAEIVAETDDI